MTGVAAINPKYQFKDALGVPMVGGTLDVYLAGTTTRTTTWQDKTQLSANTNPIVLDSRGECVLWVDPSLTYKFVLKSVLGVTQWTVDNISSPPALLSQLTFTQTGTGAVARDAQAKMREEPVDLEDFGGVCDGATDDYQALLKAYNSGARRIRIPALFYTSETLYVGRHLILEGDGSGRASNHTQWKIASGKTAIVVERGSVTYGDDSEFFGIGFVGVSKNTTTTTGTMSAASKSLTLAAAQDFATGQLVLIRGAGDSHLLAPSWYLTAATTSGSPTVTLSQTAGVHPGMVLQVAGAGFAAGTYVVSRVGATLTMSANAASTVTAGAVTVYDDLVALVMSGGGTTTLTLNQSAITAVTSAKVEHYDCGIYSQSRIKATNCLGMTLSGAAVYVHAGSDVDSRSGQTTNANNFLLRDIHGYDCRNVIRIHGTDSNAGKVDSGVGITSVTEYCFLDSSQLGNYYASCHVSGGYGYRVIGTANTTTLVGCYREGGTYNSYDTKAIVLGGNMGGVAGGNEGGSVILNTSNLLVTSPFKPFSSNWSGATKTYGQSTVSNNPLETIDASPLGGNATINFRRSNAGDGVSGLWGWFPTDSGSNTAVLFPDSGHPNGHASGSYHRNGVNLGNASSNLATTTFRRQLVGTAAPTTGTWVRGDIVWNNSPSSAGYAGWICTLGGTPGTWNTFGLIS